MSQLEEIRRELLEKAGVIPSPQWLEECGRALRQGRPDYVLTQLLHHDLRSVVRDQDVPLPRVALCLRQALHASRQPPHKATLDASFTLLVQVEEVVDVAHNLATRMSGNTGSSSKLLLVDGYADAVPLVGLYVEPLPRVEAGCKVLLKGPLTIRHGVLYLTPASCVMVGGYVEHLVQARKKALEAAQMAAGVGVDPTLRALCRNNNIDDLLQTPVDEGEGASSDVVEQPPREPLRVTSNHPPRAPAPPLMHRAPPSNTNYRPNHNSHGPPSRSVPPPAAQPPVAPPVNNGPPSFSSPTVVRNPYSHASSSMNSGLTSPTLSVPVIAPPPAVAQPSPTTQFGKLVHLLHRARTDPAYYRHLHDRQQSWRVLLRQWGTKMEFNVKKRESRLPHQEKYEYYLVAKYGEDRSESPTVTCRVSGDIMGPYFAKTATEIRTLNKGNAASKEQAQAIVKEGGRLAQNALYLASDYEVSLWLSPEKFFEKESPPSLDGSQPILLLQRRVS